MNTTYFLNQVMGNVFSTKTSPALPTGYWIGLSSNAPTIAGACTGEPTVNGTGYARIKLTSLSAPTNGRITNTAAISLPESITAWGTMTHYIVYDAVTGGNLLFFGPLKLSRIVEPNTVITIKTGELSVTLQNPAA